MLRFQIWKILTILFVIIIGVTYALPNFYPPSPAVQITIDSSSGKISPSIAKRIVSLTEKSSISYSSNISSETDGYDSILIKAENYQDQIRLKEYLEQNLENEFVIALNLAPNTPSWLSQIKASPMKLGLDLRGGVHFLMEVDSELLISTRLESYLADLRRKLREDRISVANAEISNQQIRFSTRTTATDKIDEYLENNIDLIYEEPSSNQFVIKYSEQGLDDLIDYAVSQNLVTLRNRVNELGISEPVVVRQGKNRISVQLPGVQDTAEAKKIIGKTANLEFRLEAQSNSLVSRTEQFDFSSQRVRLQKQVIITGDKVADASVGYDENGFPQVNISLDGEGGTKMHRSTRNNVGNRMAVIFVERKIKSSNNSDEIESYFDKRIISLATIQSALANQFRITGLDSPNAASELALLLRAGALAAPMNFVEEGTVGPSLGADNIKVGVQSLILGLSLVLVFMIFYYKVFGLIANIAVALNIVLISAIMSILSATLTLPGIAGIVLTIGMAVDANVLIFSRIKEELNNRLKPLDAINAGYDRAYITIVDANLTTLIVALILYTIGTGPIQGFAITLSVGILTSMFTAILVTRFFVWLIYRNRKNLDTLWI
ncbi:MAG: protein translocase subunit SecD [Gammaproteobacteria bacterium]